MLQGLFKTTKTIHYKTYAASLAGEVSNLASSA